MYNGNVTTKCKNRANLDNIKNEIDEKLTSKYRVEIKKPLKPKINIPIKLNTIINEDETTYPFNSKSN